MSNINLGASQQFLTEAIESFRATRIILPKGKDELAANLTPFSWQVGTGSVLAFPIIDIKTNISQDIVQHKYPDQDAARLENTGRNPTIISCRGLFINNFFPTYREAGWIPGTLFPSVYAAVLQSAISRETGTVNHPFIGKLTCKLVVCESNFTADFRGGDVLDLHFIETINDNNIFDSVPQKPISAITAAVDDTLNQFGQNSPKIQLLNQGGFNPQIMAALLAAEGALAVATIATSQIVGAIISGNFPIGQQIIYLTTIKNQYINLVTTAVASNDAAYADAINASNVAIAALNLYLIQLQAQNGGKTSTYWTLNPTTLSSLSRLLNADVSVLVALNPGLLKSPIIPANTEVFYETSP